LNNSKPLFERSATWIALAFVVSLFLFHLYLIRKYAVEIPIIDDWAMFRPERPAKLSAGWLLDSSNTRVTPTEHVIATEKFFVWLQYHVNGWNYSLNLVLNFLIFGLWLAWMVWFANEAAPDISLSMKLLMILFLLSPIDWFNHFMATQTCYLFYLIFFFVSAHLLFKDRQRWWHIINGSLRGALSIYSLASGFGSCVVLLIAFCIFKVGRFYSTNADNKIREAAQLATTVVLIGGALAFWILQYATPAHVELTLPDHLRFWQFSVNLVSFGFGIEKLSSAWGTFCLLIVLIPVGGILWKRKGRLRGIEWTCVVLVAGVLVNVGEIALGRAYQDGVAGSKVVRYVEFVIPLIPLSMIAWAIMLRGRKTLRAAVLGGLFTFCLITFANDWGFAVYKYEGFRRMEGRACVKEYYKGTGDGRCPILYVDREVNVPLRTWMDGARAVNVLFYRQMHQELEEERRRLER
jgi:hypothetical protein